MLLALIAAAGILIVAGIPAMVPTFAGIGSGLWFRYLVGFSLASCT